jgi:glycosyltransferase involved in cell wall biosynthesis
LTNNGLIEASNRAEPMRIAYIAPYQGKALMKQRPVVRNLSLAARVKIGLIASLLQRASHSVEILSQGEVIERQFKFYPGFGEPELLDGNIPVFYSSAFPVRFLNGLWSSLSMLRLFKERHRKCPFQVVIIYNLKPPQVACANYAIRRLGLPVILEYEDDAFSSFRRHGKTSLTSRYYLYKARKLLGSVSACVAVSPHLLAQTSSVIPKLLLRGAVSDAIVDGRVSADASRQNWVVFSGTHSRTKGLEQLVKAWDMAGPPEWELHIAGHGVMTDRLRQMAANIRGTVFDGLLNPDENAQLLSSAKIAINPEDVSPTPGNVFAFKTIECLAAGLHVITTPMGALEPEIESGITYMLDNKAKTIAATLKQVMESRCYERTAAPAALQNYGPETISRSLDELLHKALAMNHRDQRFAKANRSG